MNGGAAPRFASRRSGREGKLRRQHPAPDHVARLARTGWRVLCLSC
jgi:hypothetical protein